MLFGDTNEDQAASSVKNMSDELPLFLPKSHVQTQQLLDITERSRINRVEVLFNQMPDAWDADQVGLAPFEDASLTFEVRPIGGGAVDTQTLTGVEPSIPKYPRFRGVAHRIKFTEFEELREISLSIEGSPGNN